MKHSVPTEKQIEPFTRQTSELPNLTIEEKVCPTQFETKLNQYRIFEPEIMIAMIRDIIGTNDPLPNVRGIIKPSDELAHFLINLRKEGKFNEIGQRGLDEAIELCFLHSAAYQSALEIYRLEHEGRLRGAGTAHESFQSIIDRSDSSTEPPPKTQSHRGTGLSPTPWWRSPASRKRPTRSPQSL
jgi:hypothetical protein